MNVRAVWTGLAAFLTVSLGSALSVSSEAFRSWGLLLASAVSGLVMLALTAGATALEQRLIRRSSADPGSHGHFPSPVRHRPATWVVPSVRLAIDLLLLTCLFPLIGFTAGGTLLSGYPWVASAVLVVPSLAFLLAIHPVPPADLDPRCDERRGRLMTLALALLGFGGVLIVGSLFPGSPELRLLGTSPAIVVAFVALAALLHPSADGGLRLAKTLVPLSYVSMVAGLSLLNVIA